MVNKDLLYPLRVLHGQLHEAKIRYDMKRKYRNEFRELRRKNPKTVVLLLTPEHGNLGDHAIAYAETVILKKLGIDYYEITGRKLAEWECQGVLDVFNGYPIFINGGGNLGTLWMGVEELQRTIIQKNPKSQILILPNTVFYEENDWGREELRKSEKIYNRHKKLTICAREKASFEFMKSVHWDVKLIPDMVLSLKKDEKLIDRKGCLLCLRGDRERTLTQDQEKIIRQQVEELFGPAVADTDMVLPGNVTIEQRDAALQAKFDEFSSAELVVTDRLHGMIFCAITGTPCIVVDSKSPKVRGCYEWIKHLDYIKFAEDVVTIAEVYRQIPQTLHTYRNDNLKYYYEMLEQEILSKL